MKTLLLGAGTARDKRLHPNGGDDGRNFQDTDLITVDIEPSFNPHYIWDLNDMPMKMFEDNEFDEIHAYEILEHIGTQGDWVAFFDQFNEFWRILKPGGWFCGTVPWYSSVWQWADPGHTRVIAPGTLAFLDQDIYAENDANWMTDYRSYYKGDFEVSNWLKLEFPEVPDAGTMAFALKVKGK